MVRGWSLWACLFLYDPIGLISQVLATRRVCRAHVLQVSIAFFRGFWCHQQHCSRLILYTICVTMLSLALCFSLSMIKDLTNVSVQTTTSIETSISNNNTHAYICEHFCRRSIKEIVGLACEYDNVENTLKIYILEQTTVLDQQAGNHHGEHSVAYSG